MSRCVHGFESIGAHRPCWACEAEERIADLTAEVEKLRAELDDREELAELEARTDRIERERDRARDESETAREALERACELLRAYDALAGALPLDDRQEVDLRWLRRQRAALGLLIGKQT